MYLRQMRTRVQDELRYKRGLGEETRQEQPSIMSHLTVPNQTYILFLNIIHSYCMCVCVCVCVCARALVLYVTFRTDSFREVPFVLCTSKDT